MKAYFCSEEFKYDGTQLRPLYAYSQFGILGDSIVAWVGECNIHFEHMIDLEDVLDRSEIRGAKMLHFIVELFDPGLIAGVALQRLLASIVKDEIEKLQSKIHLRRDGDDLFHEDSKLSISICSKSSVSTMIHFAVNVNNQGTPVKTFSLEDLRVDANKLADAILNSFQKEYKSVLLATQKVKPL